MPPRLAARIAMALLSAACALAGAQDRIPLRNGLTIGPMGSGGRQPFFTDPVTLSIVRGQWTTPSEGDAPGPAADARAWAPIEAGEDGWFRGRGLAGGHVLFVLHREEPGVMILEARGHAVVYVNGEPRAGDPYANGLLRLPVALRAGANELLFRCARGQLLAELAPPEAPVALDTVDWTLPDQIEGEEGELWAGVPILNATEADAAVTVRAVSLDAHGAEVAVETGVAVPPLSVHKAPVRLRRGAADSERRVPIRVEIVRDGQVLHARDITLRSLAPHEKHVRTFVSRIDGSVQYFAVTPQRERAQGEFRDERPALFLTLHGASVEASGQAAAYDHKNWGHIIAPTNRRPFGFDWEDWGRLDAVEVLDIAAGLFDADPDRVYLTGHSMGGHGTWNLAAQFPDRFAAIGPSAGWISFWSYGGLETFGSDTPVRDAFSRAASPSDTLALLPNYAGLGVYILHGDADDNVPVQQAREMRSHLAAFHRNFAYYERPGAGHWWGNECVDWPPMFEFFRANVRAPSADQVRFVTSSPGVSATSRWATVLEQTEAMRPSRVDLSLDAGAGRIEGTTENVARLALDPRGMRRTVTRTGAQGGTVEATAPAPGEPLSILLDGETVALVPESLDRPIYLSRLGGAWRLDDGPRPGRKGPHRDGPFKSAFGNRTLLVYATGGTEDENAWAFAKARFDAETFKYRGNGAFQVVSDRAFLDAPAGSPLADPARNVVLYGNASTNAAWGALLEGRAIDLTRDILRVGGAVLRGGDHGLLAVRPRAGSDTALVGIVGGTTPAGCRATDRLPYFVSGVAYPDYTVLSPEVYERGIEGVIDAGFFAGDWSAPGAPTSPAEDAPPGVLERVARIEATSGGAEIVAFDHVHARLYATHATGIDVYSVGPGGELSAAGLIDCRPYVPAIGSVSGVAIDPAGRGLGAACIIPEPRDAMPGVLAVFDTASGDVIATFAAGYGPDAVCFSPDGGRVVVANEGEPGAADPPGSITVLDLAGVRRPADAAGLDGSRLETVTLAPGMLARAVAYDGLRIAPRLREQPWLDLEPESIAADADGAWVSLQDNNALARFDFKARAWTRIMPLGTIRRTIDASDLDGGVHIDDTVLTLPMPDGVASYEAGGRRYLVTANQGSARTDDQVRLAEARLDPIALATMLATSTDPRADDALGRLHISTIDGDADGDGDIDTPVALGSRSFSILDAETGERVYDSGSALEVLTAALTPDLFNSDGDPSTFDTRSDDRGPEPEGVTIAWIAGRTYAFIGLERAGSVMMFDVTDPRSVRFVDHASPDAAGSLPRGPEGLAIVKTAGSVFLAVGYEQSGTIDLYRIDLTALEPQPGR